jgi:type VI secretion system secreted protein Hcp
MSIDAFLKVEADGQAIEGSARNVKHFDEIDVLGWEWGAQTPSDQEGRRTGRLRANNITVTKKLDCASVPLLQALGQNKTIDATITNRKASGDAGGLEFYKIAIREGRITSISRSAANGIPEITETITLSFRIYVEEFIPQDSVGLGGGGTEYEFDLHDAS